MLFPSTVFQVEGPWGRNGEVASSPGPAGSQITPWDWRVYCPGTSNLLNHYINNQDCDGLLNTFYFYSFYHALEGVSGRCYYRPGLDILFHHRRRESGGTTLESATMRSLFSRRGPAVLQDGACVSPRVGYPRARAGGGPSTTRPCWSTYATVALSLGRGVKRR